MPDTQPASAARGSQSAGETTGALRGTGGGCPADSAPTSSAATVPREEYDHLRAQLDALLDDTLTLMDQHASEEVKREARRRIIERHAEAVRG